jgi:hypothetical protein
MHTVKKNNARREIIGHFEASDPLDYILYYIVTPADRLDALDPTQADQDQG